MRLVDTSAWIAWLTGSTLGATLAGDFAEREPWLVPTVVPLVLATVGAIVYATALSRNADVLTCDRHSAGLPVVRFVENAGE